ncbi:MAG TPA: hypothetical protein VGO56_05450 [Pyrinomonadaceae bacterium]|jgi:hypothetical protein|nr:hypothetical protein [Pyrinomonadaceae bacterium]
MSISVDQVVEEIKQREAAEKAALDAELAKINAPHRARKAKEESERREAREAEQRAKEEQSESELEAEARQKFFAGSPNASEKTYLTMRDKLREDILVSRAREAERRFQAGRYHSIYKN